MIERRNPLPVGRYWIDVSTDPVATGTWLGFLDAAKGFVHVENTESDPDFAFSIFTTTKELVWPSGIGQPTIAPASVKSRADTITRPDYEPDVTDQIPTARKILAGAGNVVTLLVVGIGVVLLVKVAGSGRHPRTS